MNSDTKEQHDQSNSSQTLDPLQDQKYSVLRIRQPSHVEELSTDDPTTPTSACQKIPVTTTCPPAPRKPKSVPMGNKRKTPSFQRVSVDFVVMINAVFVPPEVITGDSIKKVRKANVTTGL